MTAGRAEPGAGAGGGVTRAAVLWSVAALVVVLAFWALQLPISNDGTQYLSGAQNLLAGRGYATSILFFDEHYSFGTIPAPQTVWPPGYSALIAAGMAAGLEPVGAARLVGAVAYFALLPLCFLLGLRVSGDSGVAALATLWLFGVTELWLYTTTPNSELPYLALSLTAVLLMPADSEDRRRWILAGLAGAAAGSLRYTGAFLIAALGLAAVRAGWKTHRSPLRRLAPAFWFGLGASPFAALLARNHLLVGSFSGGNSKPFSQPIGDLLATTVLGFSDLLAGVHPAGLRWSGVHAAFSWAGLGLILVIAALAVRGFVGTIRGHLTTVDTVTSAVILFPIIYLPALLFTASRTMLTYGARYLLPAVPFLVILLCRVMVRTRGEPAPRGSSPATLRLLLLGIMLVQVSALERRWVARGQPFPGDPTLLGWIETNVPANEPIMALGNGQQIGHLLQRRTAALPHQRFTRHAWDEAMVKDLMDRYRIRTVVVAARVGEAEYGPFLDSVIAGSRPAWLEEVASSSRFRILAPRSVSADRTER